MNTAARGRSAEDGAAEFLVHLGYTILERNYRFSRGEIDIVAEDGDYLVFCEVKSRSSSRYGDSLSAVTSGKQRQIRAIAQGFLFERAIGSQACRFDVVVAEKSSGALVFRVLKNAF